MSARLNPGGHEPPAPIPEEFRSVLEVEAEEPLGDYDRRQAEGRDFWEGDEEGLKKAAQVRAFFALEALFGRGPLAEKVFVRRFFGRRLRPELTNSRYVCFTRLNKERPGQRQRIRVSIDLPLFYAEQAAGKQ
ncbi:hypothetical protein ACUUL3_00330 [Thiovibrio sp. JS02]